MRLDSDAMPIADVQAGRRAADFLALTKPRVVAMVVLTALLGFYLGAPALLDVGRLLATLVGTALAAGGTMALNQYMERDIDACMQRTRTRPLPEGRLVPLDALMFGAALTAAGVLFLMLTVGVLAAFLTALTSVSYLFAYTPLKQRTSLCSVVGAVPGALPPLSGWAAASGTLDTGAWVVFAIMFLWQIPHSLAIAHLYRDDYARAKLRLLPVVAPDDSVTTRQILVNTLALMVTALMPTAIGLAGAVYFVVALVLGFGMLVAATGLARTGTRADARRVLLASLIYLPVLLTTMALDKLPVVPW